MFDARPDLLGDAADEVLGWSLREMCLVGPEEALTRTEHAQPALYALSYALWDAYRVVVEEEPAGQHCVVDDLPEGDAVILPMMEPAADAVLVVGVEVVGDEASGRVSAARENLGERGVGVIERVGEAGRQLVGHPARVHGP